MKIRSPRRTALAAVLACTCIWPTGLAASTANDDLAVVQQFREQQRGLRDLRPTRPRRTADDDRALRAENLTDQEVDEITRAVQARRPGAMVNIGGASAGCDCQNGPDCSSEVWAVAYQPDASHGLRLARINQQWRIGPLQAWWLAYDALARFPADGLHPKSEAGRARTRAWLDARAALLDAYPTCTWTIEHPLVSTAND